MTQSCEKITLLESVEMENIVVKPILAPKQPIVEETAQEESSIMRKWKQAIYRKQLKLKTDSNVNFMSVHFRKGGFLGIH